MRRFGLNGLTSLRSHVRSSDYNQVYSRVGSASLSSECIAREVPDVLLPVAYAVTVDVGKKKKK